MGAYLSQPKTDKVSTDDLSECLIVGASSMQGWRNSQEDAHNSIINYDKNSSFFAVYDGHGGAEVAAYCADRLPDFLKQLAMYRDGKFEDALKHAFLEFDRTLLDAEVIEVLKILAGEKNFEDSDQVEEEEEEENLVELHEESRLPIKILLEKYEGHPDLQKLRNEHNDNSGGSSKPQSPYLRGRRSAAIVAEATNKALMDPDSKPEGSSTSAAAATMTTQNKNDNPSSSGTNKSIDNRAELVEDTTVSSSSGTNKAHNNIVHKVSCSPKEENDNLNGFPAKASPTSTVKSAESTPISSKPDSSNTAKNSEQNGSVTTSEKSITTSSAATSSKASPLDDSTVSGSSDSDALQGVKQNGSFESSNQSPNIKTDDISSTTSKTAAKNNEFFGMPNIDDDEEDAEYEFKKPVDDTSDSEDEGEDVEGYDGEPDDDDENGSDADSDEFDDEMEDEEDEDSLIANRQFCANMIEEPGKDSGCTAVVALLHGRDLYVANAGDSRCVVCRSGKALDMSLDHKPEDDEESARIIKAGGRVTQDGRVNGGLNLSRAIGDHAYKMNAELPLEEQMISALPDIKKLIITPEDEFMVLACDGIWNFMSSDEVVEFVRERLADENKRVSEVCEELFDHCLAPDTRGDGTGCDNMTAVIVRFKPKILELPTRMNPEETEDALLLKKAAITTVSNSTDKSDDLNQQKSSQKRTAENTNEAEQAIKIKRLKTDIIDGSGDDADKPNSLATENHSMETENSSTTTANKTQEQNECDSVTAVSTIQQSTAVSTT